MKSLNSSFQVMNMKTEACLCIFSYYERCFLQCVLTNALYLYEFILKTCVVCFSV
jgi:hypothetical protein